MKSKLKIFSFITLVLFGILIIFSDTTYAQCNLKVDSKIEQSDTGRGGDIYLKVKRGSGKIDIYLIDLNNPRKGPLRKETRSSSDLKGNFILVFKNVPPATYTIQVIDGKKCQVSVGGIEGVTISGN